MTVDLTTPDAPDRLVWIQVEDGEESAHTRISASEARALAERLVELAKIIEDGEDW